MEQKDLDQVLEMVAGKMDAMRAALAEEVRLLNEKIEENEKSIATLVLGFGEQVVMIESLIGQLIYASDEEKENFRKTQALARAEMFKLMQEGVGVGVDDRSTTASDALAKMAPGKQATTTEE